MTARDSCPHREYARWRARQIAYSRGEPWAPAAPVREHARVLTRARASYEVIARAAGVATMTVHPVLTARWAAAPRVAGRRVPASTLIRAAVARPGIILPGVVISLAGKLRFHDRSDR